MHLDEKVKRWNECGLVQLENFTAKNWSPVFLFAVNYLVCSLSFSSHCKIKSLSYLHFVSVAGVTTMHLSNCLFLSVAQVICLTSCEKIPLTDLFCWWPVPSQFAHAARHLWENC